LNVQQKAKFEQKKLALSKTITNLFFHEITFLLKWRDNDTNR